MADVASRMHDAECREVDAYIAGHKALIGFLPTWKLGHGGEHQSRWPLADPLGVESAELCFTVSRDGHHQTIVCLFRQRLIYRLDVAPTTECKDNHHTAHKQGLPFQVCGTHVHGWSENRDYVMINGFRELPVRRPVEGIVSDLKTAVHWVASDLNIQVDAGQRAISLPPLSLV